MRRPRTNGKETPHPRTTPSQKPALSAESQQLPVRPFEASEAADVRLLVRQELERLRAQQEIQGDAQPPEVAALADRLAMLECRDARLEKMVADLQRELREASDFASRELQATRGQLARLGDSLEDMEGRWLSEARLGRRSLLEHSKTQLLESALEDTIGRLNRLSLAKHGDAELPPRPPESGTGELALQLAELKEATANLEEELFELQRDLKKKASTSDVSGSLEDLREKARDNALGIEKCHSELYEQHCESGALALRLEKLERETQAGQAQLEEQLRASHAALGGSLADASEGLEHRLAGVVGSYNLNFEEVDCAVHELSAMLAELLGVSSKLTQKLLAVVSSKLDSRRLESSMEDLNERVAEELWSNRRRIKEIDQKEFEVENELRCLKDILQHLKSDYDRNYRRLRYEEEDGPGGVVAWSGRKTLLRCRDGKENRDRENVPASPSNLEAYLLSGLSSRERRSTVSKGEPGRPSHLVRVRLSDSLGP